LRGVAVADLDVLFEQQLDPDAVHMAAFTAADPSDREAFGRRWQRILADPSITSRTILVDGEVAGSVSAWRDPDMPGREVTYWLGREYWGRGIATEALRAFLLEVSERPLFGRCAADNVGSLRVLEKCGFERIGQDRGFANARGAEIDEFLLELRG
jgi:RimJ/RimL family protein N-acetyltransferase